MSLELPQRHADVRPCKALVGHRDGGRVRSHGNGVRHLLLQEALAGQVELDRPFITLMEAGKKQPTVSVLWRLAGGLQMTVAELAASVDERLERLQAATGTPSKSKVPLRRTK